MKRSILTEKIARRGRHILREYSVDALEFMQAGQLMTRDPATLPGDMPLTDVVRFFAEEATHRSYPVVDKEGRLLGLVSRTDALEWKVSRRAEGKLADALSDASTEWAFPETPCGEVADIMVESGIGRVPIVDHHERRVVGIISRQDLLKVRSRQKSVEARSAAV
jgi:CBS domain-containing protein